MFSVSYANLANYFYPVGNTPAVSLTQGLPNESPATVLLLGCGDLRHILFTLHTDSRPLDITACDLQPAVIARNVFLLTLLMKDSERVHKESYWNLYFHFKVDDDSLSCLQLHAQYLCSISATLESWSRSKLGRFITFCDEGSLHKTREVWLFWLNWTSADKSRFEDVLQKARHIKSRGGHGVNITALRSASPVIVDALNDLPQLHDHYWNHGTTDTGRKAIASATHLNPMFALPSMDEMLHYGTDPLLGFHLATAFVPLAADSPLFSRPSQPQGMQKVVNAAREEFSAWVTSFGRNFRDVFKIRFFAGDAIALSYQLQNTHTSTSQGPVGWYGDRTHFRPLSLGDGYSSGGSSPRRFDVIDTSNLADHIGVLNLLTAVAPLLKTDVSATLYTERLLKLSETRKELVDDLVGGDLPTLSMLLGLVSVEMATSASTICSGGENIMDMARRQLDEGASRIAQQFVRLAWKRPMGMIRSPLPQCAPPKINFDPVDLGFVLYSVYLSMFQSEDAASLMRDLTTNDSTTSHQVAMNFHRRSLPNYHRASLSAFIRFIKSRVSTDWDASISKLLDLIETDFSKYSMSRSYLQELYTWLHILDIYTVSTLIACPGRPVDDVTPQDLRSWKDIPPVVCITLKVPREKLNVFIDKDIAQGVTTPPLHCSVRSSPNGPMQYENHFAALQTGFGTVSTGGTRFSGSFKIAITEDGSAWSGQLPLLVSFYAPAWILLLEPRQTILTFGLHVTPQTAQLFSSRLGLGLTVFSTTLGDLRHVYVTKHFPNLLTKPTILDIESDSQPQQDTNVISEPKLSATTAVGAGEISSVTNRVDIRGKPSVALSSGCEVHLHCLSPFNYEIRLGKEHTIILDFPIPVAHSNIKTRIARKSSYIELVAAIERKTFSPGSFTYPLLQTSKAPLLWSLPYLSLHVQPSLDISQPGPLGWLNTHVSMMFSASQRRLRDDRHSPAPVEERTAVELKDSLLSLFMHYSGVQGGKANVFGIACPDAGGVHILLFASSLRLDLSNRTVLLDAAALPLYDDLMPQIIPDIRALQSQGNLCQIRATESELVLWKVLLPAWAERCRSYHHKTSCEYTVAGHIPLSVDKGQRCLCSCGNGEFPTRYLDGSPIWGGLLRHAIRIAISPVFHSSLVDDDFMGKDPVERCQKCKSQASNLKHCSRCHSVRYCSKDCQRKDWKSHKPNCNMPTSTVG